MPVFQHRDVVSLGEWRGEGRSRCSRVSRQAGAEVLVSVLNVGKQQGRAANTSAKETHAVCCQSGTGASQKLEQIRIEFISKCCVDYWVTQSQGE